MTLVALLLIAADAVFFIFLAIMNNDLDNVNNDYQTLKNEVIKKNHKESIDNKYNEMRNYLYDFFDIDSTRYEIVSVKIKEEIVNQKHDYHEKIETTVSKDLTRNFIFYDFNRVRHLNTSINNDRVQAIRVLKSIYDYLAKSVDSYDRFSISSTSKYRKQGVWFDGRWQKDFTTYYTFYVMADEIGKSVNYISWNSSPIYDYNTEWW